ncbi:hypothetical protein Emed_002453 [Eimeria media]
MLSLRLGRGTLAGRLRPYALRPLALLAPAAATTAAATTAAAPAAAAAGRFRREEGRKGAPLRWGALLQKDPGALLIFLVVYGGRRVEVTEFRLLKSGRGAASVSLSYVDLESLKSGSQAFSVQKKLESKRQDGFALSCLSDVCLFAAVRLPSAAGSPHTSLWPEKHVLQVMYVDQEGGVVVMADSDFDEVRVPLRLFGGSAVAEHLTPELQIPVLMHEGVPLKAQLPPSILAALRGKK